MHRSVLLYSYWVDGWKDRRLEEWINGQIDGWV